MDRVWYTTRLSLSYLLTLLIAPWLVACQATGRTPAPGPVDGRLIAPGIDTMHITEIEGDQKREQGVAISTVRQVSAAQLELLYEMVGNGGRGPLVITRVVRSDLRPIEEVHDFGGGQVATLRYTSAGVTTERRDANGAMEASRTNPDASGAYSSAVIDLVLRALPLRHGFRAELPVYFMGLDRRVSLPVRVAGEEVVSTRSGRRVDCWRVEADFPGGATEQFWIAKDSRELLRVLAHAGPNTLQRYER